jgi:hypothetical protein
MAKSMQEFLEDLKIPSESISAITIEPGATYLLVGDARAVPQDIRDSIPEGLKKAFGLKVAALWVFSNPNEVIAAFKLGSETGNSRDT